MVSKAEKYCIPSQYLALVAPPGSDYINSMILINNMNSRELAKTDNPDITLINWLGQQFGMSPSDYYFIGVGDYFGTERGLVEGHWEMYHGDGNYLIDVDSDLTTQEYQNAIDRTIESRLSILNRPKDELRVSTPLENAYEKAQDGAPFIYVIYPIKNKPIKMPNINATFGNAYEVYAIDFCSIAVPKR